MAKNDRRSMYAVLPGRLLIRDLIEEEMAEIKGLIQSGRRELIALLPGMEFELEHLTSGLQVQLPDGMDASADQGTYTEQKTLPAASTFDESIFIRRGRPTLALLLYRELLASPNHTIRRDAFEKKYGKEFSFKSPSSFHVLVKRLRNAGLQIQPDGSGGVQLLSVPSHHPPHHPPHQTPSAETPPHFSPSESLTPPTESLNPPPTRIDQLLAAFRAGNGVADLKALALAVGASSPLTFNWTMHALKEHGYKFKRVQPSVFQLVKEGHYIQSKRGRRPAQANHSEV